MHTTQMLVGKREGRPTFLYLDLADKTMRDQFREMIQELIDKGTVPHYTFCIVSILSTCAGEVSVFIPRTRNVSKMLREIRNAAEKLSIHLQEVGMNSEKYEDFAVLYEDLRFRHS